MDDIREQYFAWIYHIAVKDGERSYRRLLRYLFQKEYRYTIPFDGNRASDGLYLRNRCDVCPASDLIGPCSVLEMMVALALRIEENIMYDYEIGDRTSVWFTSMLISLGIFHMTDALFDEQYVGTCIENWMSHNYSYDGHGSLFTLRNPLQDMRTVEIWLGAMWWLDELNY